MLTFKQLVSALTGLFIALSTATEAQSQSLARSISESLVLTTAMPSPRFSTSFFTECPSTILWSLSPGYISVGKIIDENKNPEDASYVIDAGKAAIHLVDVKPFAVGFGPTNPVVNVLCSGEETLENSEWTYTVRIYSLKGLVNEYVFMYEKNDTTNIYGLKSLVKTLDDNKQVFVDLFPKYFAPDTRPKY